MNEKVLIGKVSDLERDEIQALHERKNGLSELFKSIKLAENNELYERIVRDMSETSTRFQHWWDLKSKKYNWKNEEGFSWEISFDTCEIFIVPAK
jgi:CXXX repeat modification system protein